MTMLSPRSARGIFVRIRPHAWTRGTVTLEAALDAQRFDTLIKSVFASASRRRLLAGVASGVFAALSFTRGTEDVAAKKKNKEAQVQGREGKVRR
jgi:hypothetical protein